MRWPDDLDRLTQSLRAIHATGHTYAPHWGDLAWWWYHADPRQPADVPLLAAEGGAIVWLSEAYGDATVLTTTVARFGALAAWAVGELAHRGVAQPSIAFVAASDEGQTQWLEDAGFARQEADQVVLVRVLPSQVELDTQAADAARAAAAHGFTVRSLGGEDEVDARRQASHAAFASTMDRAEHHARYLRFVRSPVYDRHRDVVAAAGGDVAAAGRAHTFTESPATESPLGPTLPQPPASDQHRHHRPPLHRIGTDSVERHPAETHPSVIGAFAVWWPDEVTGIGQFEPVGTHSAYQRRGLSRAVLTESMARMRRAGLTIARVYTPADNQRAIAAYEAVGFARTDRLVWWQSPPRG